MVKLMQKTHSDRLCEEYETLARNASYITARNIWEEQVQKLLAKRVKGREPTAEEVVQAARDATVKCPGPNCHNGVYSWGACVNGVIQHSGPCFRCRGTGRQGQSDFKRNWYYDQHRRVV